jgi:hypothetical protein
VAGKTTKNRSNLISPRTIETPCDLNDLAGWFAGEVERIEEDSYRLVLSLLVERLDDFVKWPQRALLLWKGTTREKKYHSYPMLLKLMALDQSVKQGNEIRLDGRTNGPAVAAFCIAGGTRPKRFGSNNAWSIHHLYSGKFPYLGRSETTHAARDGLHCTQSAGLVAVHPLADQACDEYPAFTWLLRAKSFSLFGYDPDHVFSTERHDEFGFVGKCCAVIDYAATTRECSQSLE